MCALVTRPYGNTDEQVPILGLGGGYLNARSFSEGVATVRHALEVGIRYFDTSPLYGQGISQAILGEALKGRPEAFMLATKLGHFAKPRRFRSLDALWTQFEENLRILHRDQVDTLQIHEADYHCWWSDEAPHDGYIRSDVDYDFANAPIMQVLQEAKEQGKCRFIGVTGNTTDELSRVLQDVEVNTTLVAFHYDLIWRATCTRIMPITRKKGIGLILAAVLQNGRLAQVHPEWLEALPEWMTPDIQNRFARLYRLQRECGLSMIELAIRFPIADPDVSMILVGASRPEEIEETVMAAQAGPLPTDLQQAIEELGTEERNPFW